MAKRAAAGMTREQLQRHEAFNAGVRCMHDADYDAALSAFRALDAQAGNDGDFQNRYASYLGLARVLTGDAAGVKLCRKAVAGNANDPELLCNLALAEHRLHNHERAWVALGRGLRIASGHEGLLALQYEFDRRRRHGIIPRLARDQRLNRWLGHWLRLLRRYREDA